MRTPTAILFCLLFVMPLACTKENQEVKVQPAVETSRALHHLAKMWELMHLVVSGQSTAILPEGVRLTWVDSTNADWDGLEFFIDFGKRTSAKPWGTRCRDGYYRSGIYRVSLSGDLWTPGLYLALTFKGKDSCTFSNGENLFRFEGRMHIQVKQDRISSIQAAFSTNTKGSKTWLESDALVQLLPETGTTYPPYLLSGDGSVRGELWQMLWKSKGLMKTLQAQGSFLQGELNIWNNKEDFLVDFDPFGNEADDLWLKVWKGQSEFLFVLD